MSDTLPFAEFGAAFFGAVAAFALEAMRRWREDRRKDLRAGNEAIFVLSQMYSVTRNFHDQAIVRRAEFVRSEMKREPQYFEYIPCAIAWNPQTRLPMTRLNFLLECHDPDILNRLSQVERAFLGALETNIKRNQVHEQFQERARSVLTRQQGVPSREVEERVGMDLTLQLQQLTAYMLSDTPRTRDDLLDMGSQLHAVLEQEYPISRVAWFTPFEKPVEGFSPPANGRQAPRWKRWVKGAVNWKRKRR